MGKKPDPQHVVIDLYQGEARLLDRALQDKSVKHPTVLRMDEHHDDIINRVVNDLRDHVRVHGTIDEIIFSGHGRGAEGLEPPIMGSRFSEGHEGYHSNMFAVPTMLEAIGKLQEDLGTPVAKRIVFSGCNLFTDPRHMPLILEYRDHAMKYQSALVFSTGMTHHGVLSGHSGNFIQITPQGEFIRDPRSSKRHPNDEWEPLFKAANKKALTVKPVNQIPERDEEGRAHEGKVGMVHEKVTLTEKR